MLLLYLVCDCEMVLMWPGILMLLTKFNWPLNDFNCATDVGHKLHRKWPAILDVASQIGASMLHFQLVERNECNWGKLNIFHIQRILNDCIQCIQLKVIPIPFLLKPFSFPLLAINMIMLKYFAILGITNCKEKKINDQRSSVHSASAINPQHIRTGIRVGVLVAVFHFLWSRSADQIDQM